MNHPFYGPALATVALIVRMQYARLWDLPDNPLDLSDWLDEQ